MGDRNCWTCRHARGTACAHRPHGEAADLAVGAWIAETPMERDMPTTRDTPPCPGHEYPDPTAAIRAKWEAHGLTFGQDGRPVLPGGWTWRSGFDAQRRGWAERKEPYTMARCTRNGVRTFGAYAATECGADAPAAVVLACIADAELAGVSDD